MCAEIIIRKQRIRITVPDEKFAFECRQFANETLLSDLNQVYEHVFFQSHSSGAYLILDKLKIDLGTISRADFENNIPRILEEKLVAELQDQFNNSYAADEHESSTAEDKQEPPAYSTESQQNTEAIILFLQTGRFPWWYSRKNGKTPAELLAALSDAESRNLLAFLVSSMRKELNHHAIKDIIQRFFTHLHESRYETIVVELSALFNKPELSKDVQVLINEKDDLIKLLSITTRSFHEQIAIHMLLNQDPDFKESLLVQLKQSFPEAGKKSIDSLEHQVITSIKNDQLEEPTLRSLNSASTSKKSLDTTESIYVFNSGLVILHPFFPIFFKALDLLDDNDQFISRKAQMRAAVLLHYLQCGRSDYKEWEMPLNKLLCGLNLGDLIPDHIKLTDQEIEESNGLLNSIIEYWTALRGCTIEALQTTFLMREGKLRLNENTWVIQIERSGVDILVDRLPWGIGTFKLPWLKEFISVEW